MYVFNEQIEVKCIKTLKIVFGIDMRLGSVYDIK